MHLFLGELIWYMVEYLVFFLSCFYILPLFLCRMCLQYAAPSSMSDMFNIFSTLTFCFISIACGISGVWPVDTVIFVSLVSLVEDSCNHCMVPNVNLVDSLY